MRSVADTDVAVVGLADQLVFALLVAAQAGVQLEELRPQPESQSSVLLVIEHPLGPLDQVAKIEVQLLVLATQPLGLPAELRRDIERIVEIAVRFLERKMEGELVAELAESIDEQAAMTGGHGP